VGLALAYGLTRVLASLLYGVKASDPLTFAAVGLILTVIALAASYLPARRASGIEPVEALRYQ
jgi:ABC-type antimicrobial peptide transport system permease subunit